MEEPHRWLVAYDVTDDPRRERIAHKLLEYGDRVQFSVFIVDARPAKLLRLRAALSSLMEDTDSVLIASLGPVSQLTVQRFCYLGRQRPITGTGPLVV